MSTDFKANKEFYYKNRSQISVEDKKKLRSLTLKHMYYLSAGMIGGIALQYPFKVSSAVANLPMLVQLVLRVGSLAGPFGYAHNYSMKHNLEPFFAEMSQKYSYLREELPVLEVQHN